MSDAQNATPTEKVIRERSPSFPFIPLKTVVDRLEEYDAKFPRQEPPADKTYLAWGMKGDTSQSQQTLAALKAFGFVEYKGSGVKRPVALTTEGRTYLRAQQESVKADILRKAALKPKWIAHFWNLWGTNVIPDEIRLDELVLQHKFIDSAAPKFLRVYDETIKFAKLSETDKADGIQEDDEEEEGADAGTPEIQDLKGTQDRQRKPLLPPRPGIKQDVFTLSEGDVVLQWPERLSAESYQDLEDWTKIILRKIKRNIEEAAKADEVEGE